MQARREDARKRTTVPLLWLVAASAVAFSACSADAPAGDTGITGTPWYPLVDTQQTSCYDESTEIACPDAGAVFFGQDAQSSRAQPSYTTSGDGLTVHDNVTGLTWKQGYEADVFGAASPQYWTEAQRKCAALNTSSYGGYADWRLPTIKELYSIWRGSPGWPYVDSSFFGHPTVDSHSIFWSNTGYSGLLESTNDPATGAEMAFGVNFDTGHIKAYSIDVGPKHLVRCVRGTAYGINEFVDNADGTITDRATGLMWPQADSASGMDWQHALAFAQSQNAANYLGHADWRLPNTKELQSLVDYTRSPGATDATRAGPAVDPRFTCTPITNEAGDADYPWYWTSTSAKAHANDPSDAAWYVSFGRAVGSDGKDLHGAGAVRFDAKVIGPSGGESRYLNYVRLVRDAN